MAPATGLPASSVARPSIVIEKWESVEALYAHSAAPHMTEYRAKVKDFVVGVKLQVTEAAF